MQVMGWVTDYQLSSRDLGIEEDDLKFPAGPGSGTWFMTEKYISRVESTLVAWYTNILEVTNRFFAVVDLSYLHTKVSNTFINLAIAQVWDR